ncbi:hypothetical protein AYO40_02615 [Planctomycetaceae bacterium SCGC AG-212-D15]|nr:hypothetical protein AYO40_02615 [Planctomycetaceae bacterium SCGC AG-212-D15]
MIRDQELLHGAALIRLLDVGEPVTVCKAMEIHPSVYAVDAGDRRVALLLKLSTKKKSPWQFTFTEGESTALTMMAQTYPDHERLLLFVCHLDGVCCLPHDRLGELVDDPFAPVGQAVSVARAEGKSYRITGPGRLRLRGTIPASDWPRIAFQKETT